MAILPEKEKTSFNLTTVALNLADELALKMGLSKTAVVETAIRRLAKEEGVAQ
jgi:hypothetical protein